MKVYRGKAGSRQPVYSRANRSGLEQLEAKRLLAGDLVAQWRAEDLVATLADGEPLTAWVDSVGGVSAGSVIGRPILAEGVINGRSAVRFDNADGADGLLIGATESPMRGRDDFSIVAVIATDSQSLAGDEQGWFTNSGIVDANNLGFGDDWGMSINSAGKFAAGMSQAFGARTSIYSDVGGFNDGETHIVALTRRTGDLAMYVDNQQVASTSIANSAPRSNIEMMIGKTAAGDFGFDGDIAEVRIYDGQLDAAELTSVYRQLNGYYDNQLPDAQPDRYTFAEDFSFLEGLIPPARGVLVNDTDTEGDGLTAVLVEGPQHGAFTLNPDGSFTYDSDPNFFGIDTFTYAARDFRDAGPTRVTIEVTPVYDPVFAVPDRYKLLSGTTLSMGSLVGVLANDQNPDQADLQVVLSQPVGAGQLELNADGSFNYDPQGFFGTTSFEYEVMDGTGVSNAARVSLVVNTPPVARDDQYRVDEDSPLITGPTTGVLANDVDAEQDALTATLVEGPSQGTMTLAPDGSFAYAPHTDYFGSDQFTYQVTDGEDMSEVRTAFITVDAVNDPPVAVADTYFGIENEVIVVRVAESVLLNDTDAEAETLSARLVAAPADGTLQFNSDGSFEYTPPTDFVGTQTFTYRAVDGTDESSSQTVLLAINSLLDQQQVVINELHIDPEDKTEQVEFVELYNRGSVPVSLGGWALRDAIDYVFPADASIEPGQFVVVTQDPNEFGPKFGRPALGPWNGVLGNRGETVNLLTTRGDLIDSVDYQLGFPWPSYGEEGGPSIQLTHPEFENDLGGNWRGASPTPGEVNSVLADNVAPQMRRVDHFPQVPTSGQPVTITTTVSDPDGVKSVSLQYQLVNPGDYITQDDPRYQTQWDVVAMVDDGMGGDEVANDGVFTAVLPGELQTHRRLVRYRIEAVDGRDAAQTVPYTDDLQPNFAYYVYDGVPSWTGAARPGVTEPVTYDSELLSSVPVYQLITTATNHVDSQFIPDSESRGGYTGGDYRWQGTMVYDGDVYDHIGFRARGGVWRYSMGKNMWKFDFHRGHRFQAKDEYGNEYATEWDKLNFSAMIQQGNFLHRGEQGLFESVGFELFDMAGTESPETHYVHFRLVTDADENGGDQYSGDFQGLYLAIEQPDGRFLEEHGLPDGNLYKIESNRAESVANQGAFEPTETSFVNTDFIRQFTGRNRPEPEWWLENVDVDRFYSYQTIAHAIHHYDTAFGKNFYYFHNPDTDKWQLHPWDLDLTWANNMFGNENHEWNVQIARNDDFNNYQLSANIELNNRFNAEYQNRVREILDLLYNPEQTGMLIDQLAAIVYQPGEPSLVDADRAMWDYNPITAESSRYTNSDKNAVRYKFYDRASTKDFAGMIKIMKDYIENRTDWLNDRVLTNEENIPGTPTVNYVGQTFGLDDLQFETSGFASPIGAEFAGMEWRIAETTDVTAPDFDPYDATSPRVYEIDALWESGLITEFRSAIQIPGGSLRPGGNYRVRARMLDNDGHWSHWSDPVQFVATAASDSPLLSSLRISEINYHPADVSPEEAAAGITDSDEFEYIELTNTGAQPIDLSLARLDRLATEEGDQGVDFRFADGTMQTLPAGQSVLVVENLEAFEIRYGTGLPVAGQWQGGLGNGGEQLTLSAGGAVIQQFSYLDTWHESTDGMGATLEIVDVASADLASWATAVAWRASSQPGGSPGVVSDGTADRPGDANRDGVFDSSDLVQVFAAGEYEDAVFGNSSWEEGDWNGDGDFTTADLVFAFADGGYLA